MLILSLPHWHIFPIVYLAISRLVESNILNISNNTFNSHVRTESLYGTNLSLFLLLPEFWSASFEMTRPNVVRDLQTFVSLISHDPSHLSYISRPQAQTNASSLINKVEDGKYLITSNVF